MSFAEVLALLQGGVGGIYPSAALSCGRGGELLCASAGDADLATVFDLASLTKALCTSLLCMRLVDAGRLDLDEEVLPAVSVRALLGHQSGLPAWQPLFEGARDRQEVIRRAAEASREPVGQRVVYSDLGYILLGDFLERRLGQRLDVAFSQLAAALDAEIAFRPLDFAAHLPPAARCAQTRRESPQREPLRGVVHDDNARAMLGVAGHAGLFGTVQAVTRFALALLDTYHDAKTSTQRALGVSAATVRSFFAQPQTPAGATFGLGWDHPTPHGAGGTGYSSAGRKWSRDGVGHLGFTGCSLWLDPASRTFVVLLSNRVCASTTAAAESAHTALKALRPALHDAVLSALP